LHPLRDAIQNIVDGRVDVALFTNATQVYHLFKVAAEDNLDARVRYALQSVVIASVGPVCTEALKRVGLKPDIEPRHPKMGSLVAETAASAQRFLTAKRAR
jgi:uroporphyrinogen-III synthase